MPLDKLKTLSRFQQGTFVTPEYTIDYLDSLSLYHEYSDIFQNKIYHFSTNNPAPVIIDAGGYIGHIYREKGLGPRVCQIYCDSREWDTSNYPPDFFDSVLIDGGHQPEVVVSDTRKALQVLRPGGLIVWHDFCPLPEIRSQAESIKGVTKGIEILLPELRAQLKKIRWINPSLILMGVKK